MKSLVLSAKFSDATSHFSKHYHDCHEMFFVTSGRARITVGTKEYFVKSGTLIIISRYEKHSVTIESPDYKRYTLRLAVDFNSENDGDYTLYSVLTNRPQSFTHAIDVCDMQKKFEALFSRILYEFESDDRYRENMLDMLLKEILIELYRKEPEIFAHPDNQFSRIVHDIQNRFQKSCNEKYTLQQLSLEYSISTFYLSHLFKKVTGYAVMNYLLSCRIANAKRLLKKTDMDVGSIALECGFSDSSNFTRKFREETGVTPSQFRKM